MWNLTENMDLLSYKPDHEFQLKMSAREIYKTIKYSSK